MYVTDVKTLWSLLGEFFWIKSDDVVSETVFRLKKILLLNK